MRVQPPRHLPPLLSATATGSRGIPGLFLGGQQALLAQDQAKSYMGSRDSLVDAMARDIVIREQHVLREQLLANMLLVNQQAPSSSVQQPGVSTISTLHQRLNGTSLSSSSRLVLEDHQARPTTALPSSESTRFSLLANHLLADGILQVDPSVVLGFRSLPPFSLAQQESNLLKLLRQNADRSSGGPAVARPPTVTTLHRRPERTSYALVQQVSAPVALLSAITPREAGRSSSAGGSSSDARSWRCLREREMQK
jgi:hypothetical protein